MWFARGSDHHIGELDVKSGSWLSALSIEYSTIFWDFQKFQEIVDSSAIVISGFNPLPPTLSFPLMTFARVLFLDFSIFTTIPTLVYVVYASSGFPLTWWPVLGGRTRETEDLGWKPSPGLDVWCPCNSVFIIYSESNLTCSLPPSGMLGEGVSLCLEKYLSYF